MGLQRYKQKPKSKSRRKNNRLYRKNNRKAKKVRSTLKIREEVDDYKC